MKNPFKFLYKRHYKAWLLAKLIKEKQMDLLLVNYMCKNNLKEIHCELDPNTLIFSIGRN